MNVKKSMRIILGTVFLLWLSTSLFIIDEKQVGVLTSFGNPIRTIDTPGLNVKAPWPVNEIQRFDRRARVLNLDPTEAFTKDTKNLILQPFVVWKIENPLTFLETVKSDEGASAPMKDVVQSRIAAIAGQIEFNEFLNTTATEDGLLPSNTVEDINTEMQRFGISILDVQLSHLGLPVQNEQSIYERMRADRSRIANKYRSEGEEQSVTMRAQADREAAELIAEAEKNAATIRSKAEAEAAKKYAETYQQDPELYQLLKDIDRAEAIFQKGGTVVMDADKRPFKTVMSLFSDTQKEGR